MPMSPLARRLVWVLALAGLIVSLTSLYVHYQLLVDPSYTSFCDVNETVSCHHAYLSRYGSFYGVPTALFGAIWFGAVLVLAVLAQTAPVQVRESVPLYLFVASTIGLSVVLYMAYAAFFVLKAVCVLCLATYAAVIGLFIVSGLSRSMPPMLTLPRRIACDVRALVARPIILSVVLVFLAGAVSAVAFFPSEASLRAVQAQRAARPATDDERSEFLRYWESLPRVTVPVPSEGAKVVIVKFSDYQCPACGQSFFDDRPVLSKYESQYPGAVRFVTKDYPLQPECNPNILRPFHTASCDAAVAVRLANEHKKGEALAEYFYGHQAMMSPVTVREQARTIGGVTDFDAGYARALEGIKADVGLARLLAIRSTPTFFVNGVKLEGPTVQTLDMAIAYELKKAGIIK
jgi:uncharacterized membrane protein/protein-disulfide isomerase